MTTEEELTARKNELDEVQSGLEQMYEGLVATNGMTIFDWNRRQTRLENEKRRLLREIERLQTELDLEKKQILTHMQQQTEAFQEAYSIEKFEMLNQAGKDMFLCELKHWIRKFEDAQKLKVSHLTLKNALIPFTKAEVFQHETQLETVRDLLPFLKARLEWVQTEMLPKIRTNAILPLGTTTAGEMRLRIAEDVPEFANMTREEQFDLINKAVSHTAEIVRDIEPGAYNMDTNTHYSLLQQQIKENKDKYIALIKRNEETQRRIREAPPILSHKEKVRLQQQSVEEMLRITEFARWFSENDVPIPNSRAENGMKPILLETCRKECEKRQLTKGETISREEKFSIAQAIGLNDLGKMSDFKSGNPVYHRISKMLSDLGYSKKTATRYRE